MKVSELLKLGYKNLTPAADIERSICGVYICDLLSWVMAHAQKGNAWITVQVHSNVVAVALLTEVSCIIIPEGIAVNEDTIKKADEEKIPILSTNKTAYEVAIDIYRLGDK
ncbi:DRTGG domain-containing protein [Caldanaerobius fijiensis DSM 17918]|uniref:DRTGG domain-containing protein n=1 Tax=Caldanaerobius fijiensis DSM 17918 TaxID=1121256 RepID=A0A1M4WPR7_9THEO|nr:DRTGG domain-containing protein [Caldanaerobius fijiensis]SHE83167.1 DRTGG domain-containing protein [Caldanaerobius fijiensis DSM 17918]